MISLYSLNNVHLYRDFSWEVILCRPPAPLQEGQLCIQHQARTTRPATGSLRLTWPARLQDGSGTSDATKLHQPRCLPRSRRRRRGRRRCNAASISEREKLATVILRSPRQGLDSPRCLTQQASQPHPSKPAPSSSSDTDCHDGRADQTRLLQHSAEFCFGSEYIQLETMSEIIVESWQCVFWYHRPMISKDIHVCMSMMSYMIS